MEGTRRFTLTYNVDSIPQGQEVEIPPFGRIPNGGSVDVQLAEDSVAGYERIPGVTLTELSDVSDYGVTGFDAVRVDWLREQMPTDVVTEEPPTETAPKVARTRSVPVVEVVEPANTGEGEV